jgi:hypothetical protein
MHSFDGDADVNKSAFMQFCHGVPVGASQVGEHDIEKHYTVKKVCGFPFCSRVVTNKTLPDRELCNYSRPGRVWLMTSRLGTGKSITHFLQCTVFAKLQNLKNQDDRMGSNTLKRYTVGRHEQNILKAPTKKCFAGIFYTN